MIAKELDRAGVPAAHLCTMLNVSKGAGGNRIVPSRSVLYPTGDPDLSPEEEYGLRQKIVKAALRAIGTETSGPQIFEP